MTGWDDMGTYGPSEDARQAPEPSFEVSFFRSVTDTRPRRECLPWSELRERLTRHLRVSDKAQAPCFSPVRYRPGASRGSDGVEAVTLAVLDFDHDCDAERLRAFLERECLACVLYSTFNHTPDAPHLRAVVPLSHPVPAERWRGIASGLHAFFAQSGCIPDPACTDPARLFYLPSARPGAPVLAEAWDGRHLDPQELEPREVVDACGRSASEPGGSRPGDVYNEWGDVLSLLEGHGWTVHERRGPGGTIYLTRPGKDPRDGISATFGRDGRRILYVFSSNAPPFEAGKGYTPFTVYALLEHGGDFASAASALASQGYVEPGAEDSAKWQGGARPRGNAATDKGDRLSAHRDALRELFSGRLVWCPTRRRWYRWSETGQGGGRWEHVAEEAVRAEAYEALRLRYLGAAAAAESAEQRKWAAARLWELESGRFYREALELVKGAPDIATNSAAFDRAPFLLNTPSGVLDLRTLETRPARPEDWMTRMTGVAFDERAECPRFLAFLHEILPQEGLTGFLQMFFGAALLGRHVERQAGIFYGTGANGKSTLLSVVRHVLGDYAGPIPRDALVSRRQQQDAARVALAACEGLRLGLLEELMEGAVLSSTGIKDLLSEEPIQVRGLYEDYRSARLGVTPVITSNTRPIIPETGEGMWRRLALVPFEVTIPENRRDPDLADRLKEEAPGILRWLLEGARKAASLKRIPMPDCVRAATERYRTEEDILAEFLDDCCVLGPGHQVPGGELYAAYQAWCNENTGGGPLSHKAFARKLRDRGVTATRSRREGRLVRLYVGIGLRMDGPPQKGAAVTDMTDTTHFSKSPRAYIYREKVSEKRPNTSHPSHSGGEGATDATDETGYTGNQPAEQNPGDFSTKAVASVAVEEKSREGSRSATDATDMTHFSKSPRAYIYRENFQKHPVIRSMRSTPEEAAGPSSGEKPPAMPAGPPPDSATGTPQNTAEAGDDASLKTRLRALLELPEGPPVVRLKGVTYSEPRKAIERWLHELEEGPPALRELARHQATGYLRSLNENSVGPPDSRKEKT